MAGEPNASRKMAESKTVDGMGCARRLLPRLGPNNQGARASARPSRLAAGIDALSETAGASYWRRERVFENGGCLQACSIARGLTLRSTGILQ